MPPLHPILFVLFHLSLGEAQEQNLTTTIAPPMPPSPECETIFMPICADMPWNYTLFPNLRRHTSQAKANLELEQFRQLIEFNCSGGITHLLCSIYAPFCDINSPGTVVKPCRSLCDHVRAGCEPIFNQLASGLAWPDHLICDNYDNSSLCFGPDDPSLLAIPPALLENATQPPLACHSECDPDFGCWGPGDHQCDSCDNYHYLQRCVANCSVVDLPEDSSGLYQNSSHLECQECDEQCVGGCTGGTGPANCNDCQNYHILTDAGERVCVAECPPFFYLNSSTGQCEPCHEACEDGCRGPLPYVDPANGCMACSRVLLDSNDRQVRCLSSVCPKGTYRDTVDNSRPAEHLVPGTDLCLPCDPLCADCIRPGITRTDCFECTVARSNGICLTSCDPSREFLDSNKICVQCSSVCDGCTGTGRTDCVQCAPGHVKDFLSDQKLRFECRESCGAGEFASEEGMCEDCHTLCSNCVGPGPANCTECVDARFQEVVREENETVLLVHCLSCSKQQVVVNGRCVEDNTNTEEPQSGALNGVIIAGIVLVVMLVGVVTAAVLAISCYACRKSRLLDPKTIPL